MRMLVLGGGRFVGKSIVAEAALRGWSVTTFSRGGAGEGIAGVEVVRGDRRSLTDIESLCQGCWDVVVDTWAGPPVAVRNSATALRKSVGEYIYISSRSVYRTPLRHGADEED